MKAAVLNEVGGVPVAGEFAEPEPAEGEVVAEVVVGALNPIDRLLSMGGPYGAPPIPSVVGREGVARLEGGDRVYFKDIKPPYGSIAERAAIDLARAYPLPDEVDEATAVALGISGTTAIGALRSRAGLKPGDTVLVLGASGAVGQIGVQVAKLLGAKHVVAAARHEPALERLASAGAADATVVLSGDYAQALRDAAPDGYDVVLDPLFGPVAEAAMPVLKFGGRHVVCGSIAGRESTVSYGGLIGRSLLGFVGAQVSEADQRANYEELLAYVGKGELQVETQRLSLEQVSEAWQQQAPHSKLVIEF